MNPDRSRADPEENVLVVDVPDDALERAAAIIRITTINAGRSPNKPSGTRSAGFF